MRRGLIDCDSFGTGMCACTAEIAISWSERMNLLHWFNFHKLHVTGPVWDEAEVGLSPPHVGLAWHTKFRFQDLFSLIYCWGRRRAFIKAHWPCSMLEVVHPTATFQRSWPCQINCKSFSILSDPGMLFTPPLQLISINLGRIKSQAQNSDWITINFDS